MANRHAQDTRIILMQLPTEDDIYIASQSNTYIQNCTYHLQTNQIPASAFWVIFCILENQSLLPRANFFFHKLSSFRYSIIRQACIVMTSYEFYEAFNHLEADVLEFEYALSTFHVYILETELAIAVCPEILGKNPFSHLFSPSIDHHIRGLSVA